MWYNINVFKQESLDARDPNKNGQPLDQEKLSLNDGTTFNEFRQGGKLSRRGTTFQNYLLAVLTLSSPLLAACGTPVRAGDKPTIPEATAAAFMEQNPDATNKVYIPGISKPEPSATAEAQKPPPEATKTPEKALPCKILPDEYCAKAEIVPYTDAQGSFEFVAIDLPADVTLTAPTTDTRFATAQANPPFYGSWAGFSNKNDVGIVVIGNYRLLKEAPAGAQIEEATPFGVTTETNHKNLNGKTIIVQIAKRNPETKKWFTPKEEVEKYFPGIYTKPIAKAINYDGPIKPVTTYHYSGGPNDSH